MSSHNPIDRLFEAVVPRAVDAVDINSVIGEVDINKLISEVDMDEVLDRVDVEKLVERIDLNLLLQRVDLNVLLQRIDLNALIGRLDVNAVVQQVDVNGIIKKVDINGLVQQVDVDGIIEKVDMPALMKRAQIDEIVRDASRGVFTRVLDALRRQLAGVDSVLIGVVNRVFRRPRELATITNGTITGRVAGGISRLAAWMADAFTIAFSYGILVALGLFLVGVFTGDDVTTDNSSALWYVLGYATFAFLYYWIGLTLTGRSIGKGLVGLRVVGRDGHPITPGRAAIRTLVYPISFILWIGLIPIVTGKRRRALHDWAAGCTVVYDWGDRPSELPAPVTSWLQRHDVDASRPDTVPAISSVAAPSTNGTTDTVTTTVTSTNGAAPAPEPAPSPAAPASAQVPTPDETAAP